MNLRREIFLLLVILCIGLDAQILTMENRFADCAPATFNFYTATSLGTYNWDFGGQGTSSSPNPVFIFSTPGVYNVTVGSYSQTITVLAKSSVAIQNPTSLQGCLPFTFSLNDATPLPTGITTTSHTWVFEDGSTTTGNPITHTIVNYEHKSFVDLVVRTTSPSCDYSIKIPDYITTVRPPVASIAIADTFDCDTNAFFLIQNTSTQSTYDNPTYQWSWKLPTLTTSALRNMDTLWHRHVNGEDTLIYTITSAYGCTSSDTVIVYVDTVSANYLYSRDTAAFCPWDIPLVLTMLNHKSYFEYEVPSDLTYFFQSAKRTDTSYEISPFQLPTNRYPISFTKFRTDFPSCRITRIDTILIINDIPTLTSNGSSICKVRNIDTVWVGGFTPLVKSTFVKFEYTDTYGRIIRSSVKTVSPSVPYAIDTALFLPKIDSFYRNGYIHRSFTASFSFWGAGCALENQIGGGDTTHILSWMTSNTTQGCVNTKVKFKAFVGSWTNLDSVYWIFGDGNDTATMTTPEYELDSIEHTYSAVGHYKAQAICVDKFGCRDTTNPIWIRIGDSIIPSLFVSKAVVCPQDTLTISKIGSTHFDRLFFVTDSFREQNCPEDTTVVWQGFNNVGWQHIYAYASKDGCKTVGIDSVYVRGPKFYLDYDFNCMRRDSVLFYLRDTFGIAPDSYVWEFGDGTPPIVTSEDSLWHKYTATGDYTIRVASQGFNSLTCPYVDNTIIKIRLVKALFEDTIFCNYNIDTLNPTLSTGAKQDCGPRYTWIMRWGTNGVETVDVDTTIEYNLPADTVLLSLIARDINECHDTFTKTVYVLSDKLSFTLDKNFRLGQYYCRAEDTIRIKLKSQTPSPWTMLAQNWSISKIINNTPYNAVDFVTSTSISDTFFVLNAQVHNADTYLIQHNVTNNAGCIAPTILDTFIFYNDKATLICPDTTCEYTSSQIRLSLYNPSIFRYEWYKNYVLLSNDTTNILTDTLKTINDLPTPYIFKVVRYNMVSGCIDSFIDTTYVKVKPVLTLSNTYDNATVLCTPVSTTYQWFDSKNVPLNFWWEFNGVRTPDNPNNPFTSPLVPGVNKIKGYFWTSYGCVDSLINFDVAYNPQITLQVSRSTICRGDTVRFFANDMLNVDTILVITGDGNNFTLTNLHDSTSFSYIHRYANTINLQDNVTVNYVYRSPNNICPQGNSSLNITVKNTHTKFTINSDTALCVGNIFLLQDSSLKGDSFIWNFGNGILDTTRGLTGYQYPQAGTYKISLTSYVLPEKCIDSYSRQVVVHPRPELAARADTLCPGDTLVVSYTDTLSGTSIYITPDYLSGNPHTSSPIKTKINLETSIKLKSISPHQCTDSIEIPIIKLTSIQVKSFDTIVAKGSRVALPVGYHPYWTYVWSPALDSVSCINCPLPERSYTTPKLYSLRYTDYRKCFSDTARFYVDIYDDVIMGIPRAFTPNGDGVNDILYVRSVDMKRLISFKVFNRLGALLFYTTDEKQGWDGTYKGILQNSEVYYYTYEGEAFIPGQKLKGEGSVLLLR